VRNVLNRVLPLALAATLVLAAGGCSSCKQSAPAAPAAKKARLPQPPEAASTAATTVENSQPRCAVVVGASVDEGEAPLEVQFESEGTCSETEGTFTWDFGDGSAASHEQNPTHTYAAAGTYTARVTLEDTENKVTDSDDIPIKVTAQQP
jgi:PKD repeat protein